MRFDRTTYYRAGEHPVIAADCERGVRHGAASLQARGLLTYPDTPTIQAVRRDNNELDQHDTSSPSR